MSRFLPADHSKGDERTIGGYAAVHARPAAFEGRDGCSYSVELLADRTGEAARPWGAFLLFVQWKRIGDQGVSGHLESEFLAWGEDPLAIAAERAAAMADDEDLA
jgi:cytochrome b